MTADPGPGARPYELLEAVARGRIGVDRRFLHSIVDAGPANEIAAEVLRFARSPQDDYPIIVDPLLTDLFRYFGTEEALEDSLTAEIVPKEQHGMAFGTLAAVNAVGDFLSSLLVGLLWSAFNVQTAFAASALLFVVGAIVILRLR